MKTRLEVLVDPLGKPVPFGQLAGKALATGDAANAQDYVFGWKVKGTYKGQALAGSGKVGGMLALQDASKPFPLQAEVSAGSTRAAVVGTLTDPLNLGALDLRLKLSGTSMANLYPLTGITLPDTPAYSTDGHLLARLKEEGGALFRYENFNGKVGASDLHGSLTFVARQPRPKLSGKLTSEQLRFADLGPLIGADSNAEKQKRGQTSRQPGDKVLPVEEFRTDAGATWTPTWNSPASVSCTATSCRSATSIPIWCSTTACCAWSPCASAWPAASWSRTSAWTAASSRCRAE